MFAFCALILGAVLFFMHNESTSHIKDLLISDYPAPQDAGNHSDLLRSVHDELLEMKQQMLSDLSEVSKKISESKTNEPTPSIEQDEEISAVLAKLALPKNVKQIRSMLKDDCMDRNGYPNNSVKTWACHGGLGGMYQVFWMTRHSQIKHPSGYCIEASSVPSDPVRMALCNELKAEQKWNLRMDSNSRFGLISDQKHQLCLDLKDGTIVSAKCTGGCSQRWWMSSPVKSAIQLAEDKLLDVCPDTEPHQQPVKQPANKSRARRAARVKPTKSKAARERQERIARRASRREKKAALFHD